MSETELLTSLCHPSFKLAFLTIFSIEINVNSILIVLSNNLQIIFKASFFLIFPYWTLHQILLALLSYFQNPNFFITSTASFLFQPYTSPVYIIAKVSQICLTVSAFMPYIICYLLLAVDSNNPQITSGWTHTRTILFFCSYLGRIKITQLLDFHFRDHPFLIPQCIWKIKVKF